MAYPYKELVYPEDIFKPEETYLTPVSIAPEETLEGFEAMVLRRAAQLERRRIERMRQLGLLL